ncbi:paired immunoglobulin-like type 2 receptor beta-2 [Peromyscus eremicus]|uniref:paired immunoglobulin-like type 2 receptor beta-2 n=1 Tax=Peromyscus eremicus TaxID=42410 RepID=UPI0027DBD6F4|nr:paired immunoglobulin-like type 2 receptor beta-2 [Peromyscus eremicus]
MAAGPPLLPGGSAGLISWRYLDPCFCFRFCYKHGYKLRLQILPILPRYLNEIRQRTYLWIKQPPAISGVQGSSIKIPFSFYFPWESAEGPQMRILWRWKHFHEEFIYNSSSGFKHEHFKDWITLNWAHSQKSGVLRILNWKEKDQTTYYRQVHLNTKEGIKCIQSINGTRLTIIHAIRTTMQSLSMVTSAVTTAGLEDTEGLRNPSLVNLGATVRVVLATAVLITPVFVLMVFLWWKQR